MGSMAAGLAGGMLGGMLFRSLGGGGGSQAFQGGMSGGGGSGMGLFEILLLSGGLFLLYRYFKRRRDAAEEGSSQLRPSSFRPSTSVHSAPPQLRSEASDLMSSALMKKEEDPAFQHNDISSDQAIDLFFQVQGAWGARDVSPIRNLVDREMLRTIEDDIESLKRQRRINRLENIAVKGAEVVERWTEAGKSYSTVRLNASLLDFTVDETKEAELNRLNLKNSGLLL
jgi:predicted lipid-binding transport protein (Tim44 family)